MNMETPLNAYVDSELRSVIRFLVSKGKGAVEVHRELCSVYSDECMSVQMVRRWKKLFEERWTEVVDLPRSGRPNTSTSLFDNIQQIRDLLEEDRRMTLTEICSRLQTVDCSRASVGRIVKEILCFRKVSCRWVSRLLNEEQKTTRCDAALQFLTLYQNDGSSLLQRVVTEDETWVHHCTPETKRASKEWRRRE